MENWFQLHLSEQAYAIATKLLSALITGLVGYILLWLLLRIVRRALAKTKIDASLQNFFVRTLRIAGYLVILISVLSVLDIPITGLIACFTAAAAAVALALKDSLSNLASGIILLFTRPFITGDYVEIASDKGTVIKIDIMHTSLLTDDNRHVVIPNGILTSSRVVNYSSEPFRRLDLIFSISYEADLAQAQEAILAVLRAHQLVLDAPAPPLIRLNELTERAADIKVCVWCERADYPTLRFDLLELVRQAFSQAGIAVPYPRMDIHLIDPPAPSSPAIDG